MLCATILDPFHSVYKILACKPKRNASRLLKSEATVNLPARAESRGDDARPPEVIRRNGGLVLSRTDPVLTSPASPAVFSMTVFTPVPDDCSPDVV